MTEFLVGTALSDRCNKVLREYQSPVTDFYLDMAGDVGHAQAEAGGVLVKYLGETLDAGYRFPNITIPKNAVITSAYLRVKGVTFASGEAFIVKIRVEATDNAATFSTLANFIGRAQSGAITWSGNSMVTGTTYNTPELKTLIQGQVNRAGWVSGNAINVLMYSASTNVEGLACFADSSGNRPVLVIGFTPVSLPLIVLVPTTLSFTAVQNGALPTSKTFLISNMVPNTTLNWEISWQSGLTDGDGMAMIQPLPSMGDNNSQLITVSVITTAREPGIYRARVWVYSTNASNSPQLVDVDITIVAPPPVIVLAPTTLNFSATRNGDLPARQTFELSNWLIALPDPSFVPSQSWCNVYGYSTYSDHKVIDVDILTTDLTPGTYTDLITVTSEVASNSPQYVYITYVVGAPETSTRMDIDSLAIQEIGSGLIRYIPILLVEDDNQNWVNFSEEAFGDISGINRLVEFGGVTITIEKELEALQSSLQTIVLDNSDGFFDQPLSTGMRAAAYGYPAAVFSETVGCSESVLIGKKCQVAVALMVTGCGYGTNPDTSSYAWVEYPLGTYIIDDLTTDHGSGNATLKLRGLQTELDEVDASKIKKGTSWYDNRPISFFVEEIVKLKFRKPGTNRMPDSFLIERTNHILSIDGKDVPAIIGSPPQFDQVTQEWKDLGLLTRAIVWRNGWLYCGTDDQVWKYDPVIDEYRLIDNSILSNQTLLIHGKIRWLTLDANGNIYGFMCADGYEIQTVLERAEIPARSGIFFYIDSSDAVHVIGTQQGHILTGLQHFRKGMRWKYASDDWHWYVGLNADRIRLPFGQQVMICANPADIHRRVYINSPLGFTGPEYDSNSLVINAPRGFMAFELGEHQSYQMYIGVAYSYGQGYQFVKVGNRIMFFSMDLTFGYTDQSGVVRLNYYDVVTNTRSPKWVGMVGNYYEPVGSSDGWENVAYCLAKVLDPVEYVVVSVSREYTTDAGVKTASLKVFSNNLVPIKEYSYLVGAIGNDLSWVVIDLLQTPTDVKVWFAILYNRLTQLYALVKNINVNLFSSIVFLKTSQSMLKSLYYDPATDYIYCYEAGGKIVRAANLTAGLDVSYLFDGDPTIDDEGYMLSNFASNPLSTGLELYGVSASTVDPVVLPSTADGKYSLFRLSPYFNDRIELGDFEGMTGWDVIKSLAQVIKCIAGFDSLGNFFFMPRTLINGTETLSIGEIGISGEDMVKATSISKGRGRKNIFNICKCTPGIVKDNPPSAALTTVPRSDPAEKDLSFALWSVDQLDNYRKTITAMCVKEGEIGGVFCPLFKYAIFREEIELYLRITALANATTLFVNSVFGAGEKIGENVPEVGDFVGATSSVGVMEYCQISDIPLDANQLIVLIGFTFEIKEGSPVTVAKMDSVESTGLAKGKHWSDEGVTYTTAPTGITPTVEVMSTKNIGSDCYVTFGEVDFVGTLYRCVRTAGSKVLTLDSVPAVVIPAGTRVNAFFAPKVKGSNYEIGGSSVWIKFDLPVVGDTTVYTSKFKVGDRFRIECPGLTLDSNASSLQVAMDTLSVARNGRQEYTTIDNKFMQRKQALDYAKRVVKMYKEPCYDFEVILPVSPFLDFLTYERKLIQYSVFSPRLLPMAQGNKVLCTPLSISHDFKSGVSKMTLRAIEFY